MSWPVLFQQCQRCGRGQHKKADCPARDVICHYCCKEGHFASQCFSKRAADEEVNTVQDAEQLQNSDEDMYFTEEVYVDAVDDSWERCWTANVMIGQIEVSFKLDTGAEVTDIWSGLQNTRKTNAFWSDLTGPVWTRMYTTQCYWPIFISKFTYNGRTSQYTVFVTKGLRNNLLGFPAITAGKPSKLFYNYNSSIWPCEWTTCKQNLRAITTPLSRVSCLHLMVLVN